MLDIHDTCNVVQEHQQLSLLTAYDEERYFPPIHIDQGTSGKPVAVILRSGKTSGAVEVRAIPCLLSAIERHSTRRS